MADRPESEARMKTDGKKTGGLAETVREICAVFGADPLNMTADDCMEFKKYLPKYLIAEIRKTAKRDGCGICEIIRWTNRKVCLRACA